MINYSRVVMEVDDPISGDAASEQTSTAIDDVRPSLTPFARSFFALPEELRTHVLLFLSPDDLGILSRSVSLLNGIENDTYLWTIWIRRTAPSRICHALFSPLSHRPDPIELVRRGTLQGVAVISAVRSGAYWASPAAVRLSLAHTRVLRATLRRALTTALAGRPSRSALIAKGILPLSASRTGASASICAKAHNLDRALARCLAHRAIRAKIGRSAQDVLPLHGAWSGAPAQHNRVVLAMCPSIKQKKTFYESSDLATGL